MQGQITAAFELGLAFFRSDAADKASNTLPNQTGYRPFGIEYSHSSARPDQIESFSVCRALLDNSHASLTTPARALHAGLLQLFDTLEPLAEASRFTAAAAKSPDLARAVEASPGLAALSLVTKSLADLAEKNPALAELAVVSPNLALVAAKAPEMVELAKASPPLDASIEMMLARLGKK